MIRPVQVQSAAQLAAARDLFLEYQSAVGFDLCFQDFDREVAGLPGAYAPPRGALLLAMDGERPVGCVALRALDERTCELKRLYVRPVARGRGVGRRLCEAVIAGARERGYARMKLDTVPQMAEAIALYRVLGFAPTAPYRHNPIPGALFMELELGPRPDGAAPPASEAPR